MEIVIPMYPHLAHRISPDVVVDKRTFEKEVPIPTAVLLFWTLTGTRPTGWERAWEQVFWNKTTPSVSRLFFHKLDKQTCPTHQARLWGQYSKWADEEQTVA